MAVVAPVVEYFGYVVGVEVVWVGDEFGLDSFDEELPAAVEFAGGHAFEFAERWGVGLVLVGL